MQVARRPQTFEQFYAEELQWARRLAFVLTRDLRFSDDLVQDAFLGLHGHFDRVENPRAYLRVAIVNAARKQRAREWRRNRAQELAAEDRGGHSPELDALLERIDRLPKRQRTVLVLRYFEDLTEVEIAEVLSCRPGTVKSLAARALERIRKDL